MGRPQAGAAGVTHLLDTNVCVSYLRSKGTSRAAQRIQATTPGDIVVCAPVREELIFGALRSQRPAHHRTEVINFLSAFPSLPFNDRAAELCAELRAALETAGVRIDFNDCLIASIALANRLALVTHNVSHFTRVPGLVVEDWEAVP